MKRIQNGDAIVSDVPAFVYKCVDWEKAPNRIGGKLVILKTALSWMMRIRKGLEPPHSYITN